MCQVEKSNYELIAEFTSLNAPDISKTVRALEDNGYVKVSKIGRDRYPETIIRSTELGRAAMLNFIQVMAQYFVPS